MLKSFYLLIIKNTIVGITLLTLLFGCQVSPFEYQISDSYAGPCIVFVMENEKYNSINDSVILENGLGVIGGNVLGRNFLFKSLEKGNLFEIVEIGAENKVTDSGRYVFQLAKGSENNNCSSNIRTVTFLSEVKRHFSIGAINLVMSSHILIQ
ncbi:hypothetical protein [Paraflavitalea speifideaquila]|uniref:hypothetical protein n=1 Tax=Paraflavitalea speifideaquila TaxID=3076558 RepID=UPI0028E51801|nr:hypothetical protein [Paraflavitalea speifideiaquila]